MEKELNERLSNVESKIKAIDERNRKVELDKSWELSLTRKIIIAILTYLTIVIVMESLTVTQPWINALVPTLGFILSTLSLPLFKDIWLKKHHNSRKITE